MRYMMIVKGDENIDPRDEAGPGGRRAHAGAPPAALMEAIDKLGQEAFAAGKMISFGGLQHTAHGARVRSARGKLITTDGPFTEAKEVIGGFSIMNLASKEEAIREAQKFMELHRVHWPEWEGECEIRLMYEDGEHP